MAEQARTLTTQACSCSYPVVSVRRRHAPATGRAQPPQPSMAAFGRAPCVLPQYLGGRSRTRQEADRQARHGAPASSAGDGPQPISGYTPANYITYSDQMVQHWHSVVVHAPRSVCFQFFSDWNRLVDFLDLVSQIGLDPATPDKALFQCFYRHELLPVMEIVFVLQKTRVVPDERIEFETVWGMPMTGLVTFDELPGEQGTRVSLQLQHAIPGLLLELRVGPFGLTGSLGPIFQHNLDDFKRLVEVAASDPAALPPRQEADEVMGPVPLPWFESGDLTRELYEAGVFDQAVDAYQQGEISAEEFQEVVSGIVEELRGQEAAGEGQGGGEGPRSSSRARQQQQGAPSALRRATAAKAVAAASTRAASGGAAATASRGRGGAAPAPAPSAAASSDDEGPGGSSSSRRPGRPAATAAGGQAQASTPAGAGAAAGRSAATTRGRKPAMKPK